MVRLSTAAIKKDNCHLELFLVPVTVATKINSQS